MHLAIGIASLAVAIGALTFVIVSGRKTKQLYAEAEANWKKAEEGWNRAAETYRRMGS